MARLSDRLDLPIIKNVTQTPELHVILGGRIMSRRFHLPGMKDIQKTFLLLKAPYTQDCIEAGIRLG